MPCWIMAMRSTPMPKAKPEIFAGLYASSAGLILRRASVTLAKTAGSTIPQPSSSIQPDCLHLRHPEPAQKMHEICTSALGSVKGKKLGKKRVFTPEPNSAFMAWSSVPFRSENVMFVSTHNPST